jgi:hypothetical protein
MPQSLNLFRVFCIIHWTLIVVCHKSLLNSLSSVAVFLFGLLLQKVLAYSALTIPALKGNLVKPKKNDVVPVTRPCPPETRRV